MRVRRGIGVWAVYAALSLYFTWPLLASGQRLGIADWDALLFQHATVVKSIFEYGQLPFWNPWYCGGNVLWQNPQVPLITPVYVLALFMPVAVAMKAVILAHYVIGFAGMHMLLTRTFGITWRPLLIYLAALFVLAGGPALHLIVGHATFLPYFYLPWLLLVYIRAIEGRDGRAAAGAGAVLALVIYSGGLHVAFMAAMALTVFSAAAAVTRRDWRPLGSLLFTGIVAAMLSAPKVVPLFAFAADPRIVDIRWFHHPDKMTLELMVHAFADPFQYPRMLLREQKYGWHEYGNYLGFLGAPLIVAAFAWLLLQGRRLKGQWLAISLAVTGCVLVALMFGEAGPYAPYVWLAKLPLLSQFRLPSRYTLVFTLFAVGMVAAVARAAAGQAAVGRELRQLAGMVLMIATAALAYQNRVHFAGAFPLAPAEGRFQFQSRPPAPAVDAQTDGFGGDSPMVRGLMQNRAVLRCNEPLTLPGEVDPAQPIVFADGPARVSDIRFTPNRVSFVVVTENAPARAVFNVKYVTGWRSDYGSLALDPATGLAYVAVPPLTASRVELRFVPQGLIMGVVLFALGLLLIAAAWRRQRRHAPGHSVPSPGGHPA